MASLQQRLARVPPSVQTKIYALFDQGLCMPSDFDDRVISLLTSLPAHDAAESVSKLESALRIPGSVRNPSAYLAGVVKRLSGPGAPGGPMGGPGGRPGGPPSAATPSQLAPAAAGVLEQLIGEGRMRPGDLEGRNLANVAALPPEMQLFVMRTFADRNLHGIRNMAAFFATHLSQAQRDVAEGRARLPPPGSVAPAGLGGGPPHGMGGPGGLGPAMQGLPTMPPGSFPPQMGGPGPAGQGMAGGPGQMYGQGAGGAGPLGSLAPPQQLAPQPGAGYAPQAAPQQAQQAMPPWAQQQQQGAQMNGSYDPAAVQLGGQQQGQQAPYGGYLPPQQAQQAQQAQQGLPQPVDFHQLGGLLQSLSAPGAGSSVPQPLGGPHPTSASPRGGGGGAPRSSSSAGGPPPRHFGLEQLEWGVRVDEFHSLSPFARYVHPAAALKLQQLWDAGNRLVSLLDDASWEALAALDAQHGVAAVGEVAEGTRGAPDDLHAANRLFAAAAARYPKRPDAPTAASIGGGGGGGPAAAAAAQPQQQGMPGGQGVAYDPLQMAPQQAQQAQQAMGGMQPHAMQGLPGGGPAGMATQQLGGYGAPSQPPLQQQPLAPQHAQQQQYGQQMMGGPPDGMAPPQQLYGQPQGPPLQPSMAGPGGPGGFPPAAAPPVQLPGPCGALPPPVQARIAQLMDGSGGLVRLDHFDARIVDMMQKMGADSALRGLEEFAGNDPRGMRSVTAYLIGCLKKYQEDALRRGGPGGPPHGGPPPQYGGGGGGPPPQYGGGGGGGPPPQYGGGAGGPDRPRDAHRHMGPPGGGRGRASPYSGGGRGGRGPYDGGRGGGRAGGRGGGFGGRGGRDGGYSRGPAPRGSPVYD